MTQENFENTENCEPQNVGRFDTLEGFPEIRGYDFEEKLDFDRKTVLSMS